MKPTPRISLGRRHFSNALVKSPHHDTIMGAYYEMKKANGKVDLVSFHAEHVVPLLADFKYESFRQYIRKVEDPQFNPTVTGPDGLPVPASDTVFRLQNLIKKSSQSTREGIALALGIGLETLEGIAAGTVLMSAKERTDLLFKAMKAQDSRIAATRMIRQDNREQAIFENVFSDAAYQEENE